jgi:hypothetical protein
LSEHGGGWLNGGQRDGREGKGKPRMKDCSIGITDGLPHRSMNHGLCAKLECHLAVPPLGYIDASLTVSDVQSIFKMRNFSQVEVYDNPVDLKDLRVHITQYYVFET